MRARRMRGTATDGPVLGRVVAALCAAILLSFAVAAAPASAAGAWSPTGSLNHALEVPQSALLTSGNVLVVGGVTSAGPIFNAEVYNAASGTWSLTAPMVRNRGHATVQPLNDGTVLVAGGYDASPGGFGELSSAEIYDPATGTWTLTTGPMSETRVGGMSQLLPNGKVLVFGGSHGAGPTATAELYDPTTGTWSIAAHMLYSREGAVSALLPGPGGQVLVAGGTGNRFGVGGTTVLSSAEVYDPATDTWSLTSPMSVPRAAAVSAPLPGSSGKVLVAGGYGGGVSHSSAEIYDPLSHTWAPAGSMSTTRDHAMAQVLPNNQVLVAGGHGPAETVRTAELYDPAAGTWSGVASMTAAREGAVAQRLLNGRVLVAGGYVQPLGSPTRTVVASAELFGPAPPTAAILTHPADPTKETSATFTFKGAADSLVGGTLTFMCSLDHATAAACATGVASDAVASTTVGPLADGEHTFSVYAIDATGNPGAPADVTWHIDTHAPTVALTGTPADPTNATGATFAFAGDDSGGAVSSLPLSYQCALDTGPWGACTNPKAYAGLADGTHTFHVRAIDAVGNVGTDASSSWLIDTVPPQITIAWPQEGGRYSLFKSVETSWSCTDDWSGVGTETSTPAGNHRLLPKVAGPGTFTVDCADRAGNTATDSVGYTMETFAQIVLDDHPVAYYRLNESMEAETVVDSSGNGHDGGYKNDTAWEEYGISGDGDSARRFIGDGGYVYVNGIQAPQYTLTLGGWVSFDDADDASVLDHGHDAALYLKDGHLTFRMMGTTITDPATVQAGQWYFVAGTWNRWRMDLWTATGTPGIGNLPKVAATARQPKRPTGTSTFYIGYGENVPWLRGVMDEVFYFAKPLKPQRISELWLADPPARAQRPLARVAIPSRQRADRAVVLGVRAVRSSVTVTVTGRIAVRGRAFTLVPATRFVTKGATAAIRLRIPPQARTAARRALARDARVIARVRVRVRDASGTVSVRTFAVRLTG